MYRDLDFFFFFFFTLCVRRAHSIISWLALLNSSTVWDSSIHNYKLTDTAEDEGADEYDQYVFTVRRKFDWENKYESTVVDIKSPQLKDILSEVMDGVKGVSLVEETPTVSTAKSSFQSHIIGPFLPQLSPFVFLFHVRDRLLSYIFPTISLSPFARNIGRLC